MWSSSIATCRDGKFILYTAAKAAVRDITIKLARQLGPEGIRVNAIAPSITLTERIKQRAAEPVLGASDPARRIPLGRFGTTEDAANAVEFLVTDLAQHVNGVLHVAGGRHRLNAD